MSEKVIWPRRWESNFPVMKHPQDWDAQLRAAFPDGVPADDIICRAIEQMAHARGTYGDYPGCQDLISAIRKYQSENGKGPDEHCNHCGIESKDGWVQRGWYAKHWPDGRVEDTWCICQKGKRWFMRDNPRANWQKYRRDLIEWMDENKCEAYAGRGEANDNG